MQLQFPQNTALPTRYGILYAALERLTDGAAPTNGAAAYASYLKQYLDRNIRASRTLDPSVLLTRATEHVDTQFYEGEFWHEHLSNSGARAESKAQFGAKLQQTIDKVVAGR